MGRKQFRTPDEKLAIVLSVDWRRGLPIEKAIREIRTFAAQPIAEDLSAASTLRAIAKPLASATTMAAVRQMTVPEQPTWRFVLSMMEGLEFYDETD